MVRAASGKVDRVPKRLAPSLRRLLRAMLDPRPERRPSAAALAGGHQGTALGSTALPRLGLDRRTWAVLAGGAAALALVVGAVAAWPDGGRGLEGSLADEPAPAAGGDDCVALPYQPCGQSQPAPFTDGSDCIDDHDDYDRAWENGCEAVPDDQDGRPLDRVVSANIVPADDVDSYPMEVEDHLHLLCDGTVELRLEAPPGIALSLEVYEDDRPVESATATADAPAVVTLGETECGGDDKTTLDVVVRPLGADRVAADYVLSRSGSF
jgi:hypothetical protein